MSETMEQVKTVMEGAGLDTASVEKIMDKLIVADKNLILKTDIENSMAFTALIVISDDLKRKGLRESAKTLNRFIDAYIKVRVSYKRLSRKEILDAISAIKREQSNSIISKLIGGNDKEKK
jgi:hypothetical protein